MYTAYAIVLYFSEGRLWVTMILGESIENRVCRWRHSHWRAKGEGQCTCIHHRSPSVSGRKGRPPALTSVVEPGCLSHASPAGAWGSGTGSSARRGGAAKVSALLSVVRRLQKKENVTEYFPSLRRSRRCSCRVLVFREVSPQLSSSCRALLLQRPPRAILRCTSSRDLLEGLLHGFK